jgi:hypothetical protein
VDFPTAIGMVLERDDGSTLMEIDGDKGKQGGPTFYIDTNALRVPRENMEAISPLKNGMGMFFLWVYHKIRICMVHFRCKAEVSYKLDISFFFFFFFNSTN